MHIGAEESHHARESRVPLGAVDCQNHGLLRKAEGWNVGKELYPDVRSYFIESRGAPPD